jgi:hypothetical protein
MRPRIERRKPQRLLERFWMEVGVMLQSIEQYALQPFDVVFERSCPGCCCLELAPLDAAAFRVAFGRQTCLGRRTCPGGLFPLEGSACLLGLSCLPSKHPLALWQAANTSRFSAHTTLLAYS